MAEVVTPLKRIACGDSFTADNGDVFVITDQHTHSDILRFVVADVGLSEAIFLLSNLKDGE